MDGSHSLPVVIDTDPGIDDVLALLLATAWPRCDVRTVSASYGNIGLDFAARNARIALERGGAAGTLVLPGADRPLVRPLRVADDTHGPEGLGDHEEGSPPLTHPSHSALRDALRAAREPVTLVTLGPLTNLAHALRLDPVLVRQRVKRHVMMGGGIAARGTATATSEFNIWCDPEAAAEVFAAQLGTEMVGLDITRKLVITGEAVATLAHHADAGARWLGRLLGFYVRFHEDVEQFSGAVIHDPLAVALAVEPGWARGESMRIRVDLGDDLSEDRGRTAPGGPGDPAVWVYREVDIAPVHELLIERVFGRWLSPRDFAA